MRNEKLKKGIVFYYQIEGLNLDALLNRLAKSGVELTKIKKTSRKKMKFGVRAADVEKFFAITDNLCYNVKKLGEGGKFYPFLLAKRKIGVVLGALIFAFCAYFAGDYVLKIEFFGSGKAYAYETLEYLNLQGVKKWSRFSSFDLNALGDKILANNANVSFASAEKKGNSLIIYLAEKTPVKTLKENVYSLECDVDGAVEEITVYRGTPLVKTGDSVSKGEQLVGGYAVVKEKTVPVNVLARVSVIYQREFVYLSSEGQEQIAEVLATETLGGAEVVKTEIKTEKKEDKTEYRVKIFSRKIYDTCA